ncbi:MAG: methyltransferase domain-containing protein [Chloroflexota bacterium]
MIEQTISVDAARRVYNRLGRQLNAAERYEAHAKSKALQLLATRPNQRILHVGVGTGREHAQLHQTVVPDGVVVGVDLSRTMLELTRSRIDTPLCEGNAVSLPFANASFDRIFSAYMLDLIDITDIFRVLDEFRRVLKPDGRMVLVSLTEGISLSSRLFVALWKLRYVINPHTLGGCRPIRLSEPVQRAGFTLVTQTVVVQNRFPSEIVVAIPT